MANVVSIQVSAAGSTAAKDVKALSTSVQSEAEKVGKAAGDALTTSFDTAAKQVDAGSGIDHQRSAVTNSSGKIGHDAGKELATEFDQQVKQVDASSGMRADASKLKSEAGKSGRDSGKQLADEFEGESKSGLKNAGSEAFGGFADEFKIGAAGVGIAAAGFLVDSFNEGLDFSKTKNVLAARLGLVGPDAQRAGDAAGALWTNGFTDTAEEAADAVRSTVSGKLASINDGGAVQRIAGQLAGLSKTTGEDMDSISSAVSNMVKNGLVKNSQEGLDLVAQAFQKFGPYAGDVLDTIKEYSTQFKNLGIDGQTSMGLIQQMVDQGIVPSTDKAADLLKEFSIRVHDTSQTSQDAFKQLGINQGDFVKQLQEGGPVAEGAIQSVFDKLSSIKDPIQRNKIGVELMGTQWEDTGGRINGIDLSKARGEMGNTQGAAQRMTDAAVGSANTITARFSRMSRDVSNYISQVNDAFGRLQTVGAQAQNVPTHLKATGFFGGLGGLLGFATGGITGGLDHRADGGGSGGWTQVNERGPEIVKLPSGSMVYPTGQSQGMLSSGGGGTSMVTINLTGADRDLMDWLKNRIRIDGGGDVQTALGQR
jgi:phage-related minor tail protein